MNKNNPFLVSFGQKPEYYVSRVSEYMNVISNFSSIHPPTMCYMITGVRGSGKTVFMTDITDNFRNEGWIVVDLIPNSNMIASLISHLYNEKSLKKLFIKADININAFGINVNISENTPTPTEEIVLENMLNVLKKHNKKLLLAIDEVVNNENVRIFSSLYQLWIRKDYPVFFLMTGLYENIYELQNVDNLTFLYRAPKIHLKALDKILVAEEYKQAFDIDDADAYRMADIVNGYSYAFQILGYLKWNNNGKELDDILPEFDYMLKEYSYDKIWSELSDTDKDVLSVIASEQRIQVKKLREQLNMSSSKFSVYRERLIKKGIIDTSVYGEVAIVLPRFNEYITKYQTW